MRAVRMGRGGRAGASIRARVDCEGERSGVNQRGEVKRAADTRPPLQCGQESRWPPPIGTRPPPARPPPVDGPPIAGRPSLAARFLPARLPPPPAAVPPANAAKFSGAPPKLGLQRAVSPTPPRGPPYTASTRPLTDTTFQGRFGGLAPLRDGVPLPARGTTVVCKSAGDLLEDNSSRQLQRTLTEMSAREALSPDTRGRASSTTPRSAGHRCVGHKSSRCGQFASDFGMTTSAKYLSTSTNLDQSRLAPWVTTTPWVAATLAAPRVAATPKLQL